MTRVAPDIRIEEIIEKVPGSVGFLVRKGLPCLVCGEPS